MHISNTLDLPEIVATDCLNMLLGDKLGAGASRIVYEFMMSPRYVIKLEIANTFQNTTEHLIWTEVRDTKWKKWFAPVVMIAPSGNALIMEQTTPINGLTKLPHLIPSFFADLKRENFGVFQGRVVCHDYGLTEMLRTGFERARMVKTKWR